MEFKETLKETLTDEFCQLVKRMSESGLDPEIMATALLEMKNNPKSSPLLCLQIAVNDWDA